jgi:hypothetical protein
VGIVIPRRTQYPRLPRLRLGRGSIGDPLETGAWGPTLWRLLAALLALAALLLLLVLGTIKLAIPGFNAARAAVVELFDEDPVTMPVPEPGSRTLRGPAVQVVVIDDSSSMDARNDPGGERHLAVGAYGRWLERYGRSRDRFGVVRFALEATSSGALHRASALAGGAQPLAGEPVEGQYTQLMPAVEQAERVLEGAPDDAQVSALIISDGEVRDAADAVARLRRIADRIEVVVLDRDDTWDRDQSSWKQPGVTIIEARNRRPNELGATLARSFMQITGEHAR